MAASNMKLLFLILTVSVARAQSISNDAYLTVDANSYTKAKHNFRDMPTIDDLDKYVGSLQKLVQFCAMHKKSIDINFAFGLFLINVNLKTMLKHRHTNVPLLRLQPLKDLILENTELLKFFDSMVKNDNNDDNLLNKDIYSLFSRDEAWVARISRFDMIFKTHRRNVNVGRLVDTYGRFDNYTNNIYYWNQQAIPDPKLSDACIASLSKDVKVTSINSRICKLPFLCQKMLVNGTNMGYSLTHRLLLLLLARLGEDCLILSRDRDAKLASDLCSFAYSEAEYIALNNYRVIDLLMEQVAICSLNGNVEFLHREWLNEALKHQMPLGCFGLPKIKRSYTRRTKSSWVMARKPSDQGIAGSACNGHLTATIAAALSGAIRFIVMSTRFPEFSSLL